MAAAKPFIPPGGFVGFGQQTPAVQALISISTPARRKTKKKKTARKNSPTKRSKSTTRRAKKPKGRLVKGSAEAKRRMAQIRKMKRK